MSALGVSCRKDDSVIQSPLHPKAAIQIALAAHSDWLRYDTNGHLFVFNDRFFSSYSMPS